MKKENNERMKKEYVNNIHDMKVKLGQNVRLSISDSCSLFRQSTLAGMREFKSCLIGGCGRSGAELEERSSCPKKKNEVQMKEKQARQRNSTCTMNEM